METVLRVVLVYLFLMFALRVMGKREFGEMAPFDFAVLLLIPEMFSQAMSREDFSLTNAFVAVGTLLTLVFATSVLSYRFKRVGEVVAGVPAVLVRHGHLVTRNLDRERVSPDEVLDAMHAAGLHRMDEVRWAILETDGRITIIPWQPSGVTPAEDSPTV
ncbi:MAG TPA: YetF domain-containing protein [Longimicrobiales bacterium]